MLVEVVHSIDELLAKVDAQQGIHYEIEYRISAVGDTAYVKLTLYGIGRNALLVKCVIVDTAGWDDRTINMRSGRNAGSLSDSLKLWIGERMEEFERVAEKLGATPGRYEV